MTVLLASFWAVPVLGQPIEICVWDKMVGGEKAEGNIKGLLRLRRN